MLSDTIGVWHTRVPHFCFKFNASLITCREFGIPYLGNATVATRTVLPISLQSLKMAWPSVFGCVFMCTWIHPCTCTNTVRECTLKVDWEKNPLSHQGNYLALVLPLIFWSYPAPYFRTIKICRLWAQKQTNKQTSFKLIPTREFARSSLVVISNWSKLQI